MDDFEKLRMEGLENGNKSLCQEINRLRERIEALEQAAHALLGALEHGRGKHIDEAVADLRELINE